MHALDVQEKQKGMQYMKYMNFEPFLDVLLATGHLSVIFQIIFDEDWKEFLIE